MNSTKQKNWKLSVAVLSTWVMGASGLAALPVINTIALQFPEISYSTITLVANLAYGMIIPGSIFTGQVAGKFIKYKTMTILGLVLSILGGCGSIIATNFAMLLVFRAICGFGIGVVYVLNNSNINRLFEGQTQKIASLLSIGMIVMNAGALICQYGAGWLASINWKLWGLVYLIGIVGLITSILYMPGGEVLPTKEERAEAKANKGPKVKMPSVVWIFGLAMGITLCGYYPVNLNMSTLLAERGLGDSVVAGTILSFYTIGGFVGAALFGTLYKFAKKYVLCVSLIMLTIGELIIYFSHNLIIIGSGVAIVGIAAALTMPALFMLVNIVCEKEQVPKATSIISAFTFAFMFLCSYYIGLIGLFTGDMIASPMLVGSVIMLTLSAILFVIMKKTKIKGIDND